LYLRGPTSKGREGGKVKRKWRGRGRKRKGKRMGKGGEEKGGMGRDQDPKYFGLEPPLPLNVTARDDLFRHLLVLDRRS